MYYETSGLVQVTQEWSRGVSIGGKKISFLRYADDTIYYVIDNI